LKDSNGNGNGKYGGGVNNYNYSQNWVTQGLSCYLTGNVIANLQSSSTGVGPGSGVGADGSVSAAGATGNFDPYSSPKIGEWYNYLANSMGKIFGWTVDYHLTDPDGKGIDRYYHEYQLFNIVDVQKIKIIVPENNFPDNQVVINEFALDMLDTFQILILKDEFHKAFGIDKRPNQKDIIFFCQANRFYRVRHAQIHREIMYMGIYYNVVLEKYEVLANEQNLSDASRNLIEPLTKDNTINALFGDEMREQENKIMTDQFKPTTHEVYRLNINPKLSIVKKDIYNSLMSGSAIGNKIADNYYNLSSLSAGTSAVTYSLQDLSLKVSDNRAFNLWFSFNNKYDPNKVIDDSVFQSYYPSRNLRYEFLNNYDSVNQKGYKLWYSNGKFVLTMNDLDYYLNVTGLTTNIWYGLTINMDNRQRKVSLDLFKRNYGYNITMFNNTYQSVTLDSENRTGITYYTSAGYRPVKNNEINVKLENSNLRNMATIEYENIPLNSFDINQIITVYASDIKMTNLRIFNDVIPDDAKSNILLQRVIKDANYLIIADNATRQLYTSNIINTRWE